MRPHRVLPIATQEPKDDTKTKVAQGNFPFSIYDRPSFAAGNLLRGHPDAAIRAIFEPNTLSPDELKKSYQLFVDTSNNPLMDTILDIATNPLVILGLVSAVAFPIASPGAMAEYATSLKTALPAISKLTSKTHSAWSAFRNVPGLWEDMVKLVNNQKKYEYEMYDGVKTLMDEFKAKAGRALTDDDMLKVGAFLEDWHKDSTFYSVSVANALEKDAERMTLAPELEKNMGTHLVNFAKGVRKILDKDWESLSKDSSMKKIMQELKRKGIDYTEGYLPRAVRGRIYEYKWMRGLDRDSYMRVMYNQLKSANSAHLNARKWMSLPNAEDLERLKELGVINDEVVQGFKNIANSDKEMTRRALDEVTKEAVASFGEQFADTPATEVTAKLRDIMINSSNGHIEKLLSRLRDLGMTKPGATRIADTIVRAIAESPDKYNQVLDMVVDSIGAPGEYTIHAGKALNSYVRQMAPTKAWYVKDLGKKLMSYTKHPEMIMNPWQKQVYMDTVLPHLKGIKTYPQMQRAMMVKDYRMKVADWLKTSNTAKKMMPKKTLQWLTKTFEDSGAISDVSLGAQITHWYYLSALGLNMSSASKNTLQNFITTMAMVGPKSMGKGLKVLASRYPKYEMLARKIGDNKAMAKVFPEFYKAIGPEVDIAGINVGHDLASQSGNLFKGSTNMWDTAKKVMMMPFSASEKFNRLWAFYSSHGAALADGASKDLASKFARTMVYRTQFPGGPLGMPLGLLNVSAPLRQFMHFPMRYLGYMLESTHMGADPNKLSLGIIGRNLGISAGLYSAVKHATGTDISSGLMMGALPTPTYEGQPFYPFPLVPPVLATLGTAVSGVHSGDYSKLGAAGAMLVPAGLAGRRVLQNALPKYAKYKNRTPDGRIPLYNDKGALIDSVTPFQLVAKSLGIQEKGISGEQQLAGYLLKQREQIRNYRREYIQALASNQLRKAEDINKEFQQRYPDLGPLQIRKSDIKAETNRREISRLHRIIKGIPSDYRPVFQQFANDATIQNLTQDVHNSPDILETYQQQGY